MKIILMLVCLLLAAYCWEVEEIVGICDAVTYCQTCVDGKTCTACQDGHYLDVEKNECPNCTEKVKNCQICNATDSTVNCYQCSSSLFPTNDFQECKACGQVIDHCETCEPVVLHSRTQCHNCTQGYDLSDDRYTCSESSSASTIIIVSAVVGGVVLIGAGFAIFKCMNKRKKGSRLLQDQQ